jgi:hypothetical protein
VFCHKLLGKILTRFKERARCSRSHGGDASRAQRIGKSPCERVFGSDDGKRNALLDCGAERGILEAFTGDGLYGAAFLFKCCSAVSGNAHYLRNPVAFGERPTDRVFATAAAYNKNVHR